MSPYATCYPEKLENNTLNNCIVHLDGLLDRGQDKGRQKRQLKDKVALNQGQSADLWQVQKQELRLFAHWAVPLARNPRNCVHTLNNSPNHFLMKFHIFLC